MKSYLSPKNSYQLILLVCVGLGWILLSRVPEHQKSQKALRAPQVGFQPPSISLLSLEGSEWNMEDASGRPLVINFWASWCPPCKAEMPAFERASEEYQDTDLIIAAINATNQDSIQNVNSFLQREDINLLILLDRAGVTSKAYNIHSLPTTYFINRDGRISKILIGGPIPLALLRTEILKLLQE